MRLESVETLDRSRARRFSRELATAVSTHPVLEIELPLAYLHYANPNRGFKRLRAAKRLAERRPLKPFVIVEERAFGMAAAQKNVQTPARIGDYGSEMIELSYWHGRPRRHGAEADGARIVEDLIQFAAEDHNREIDGYWMALLPNDSVKSSVMRQLGFVAAEAPRPYVIGDMVTAARQLWVGPAV